MKYSRNQIQAILDTRDFEYQRVELPYGLHTKGIDRSKTRDMVFPQRMDGKSVLDIGSALGYFCFEAEKRGADPVLGIEMRGSRYQDSVLLKEILESKVSFVNKSVFEVDFEQKFDYVLVLNVVHHAREPMRLIHLASSLTRETLVLEFPTLLDIKFRKQVPIPFLWLVNRFPLIGVSSIRNQNVDQTFLFSPEAIRQIVLDHVNAFSTVEIVDSPLGGRKIAICRKAVTR